jgi:hypothetical protein
MVGGGADSAPLPSPLSRPAHSPLHFPTSILVWNRDPGKKKRVCGFLWQGWQWWVLAEHLRTVLTVNGPVLLVKASSW